MPRVPYDPDAATESSWRDFESWLTDHVFTLEPFDFLIVDTEAEGYVQVIHSYQGRLVAEVRPGSAMDAAPGPTLHELERLGWGAPGPDNADNWRTFWVPEGWNPAKLPTEGPQWISVDDAREVAQLLVATLRHVLGVPAPQHTGQKRSNTGEGHDAYWGRVSPLR